MRLAEAAAVTAAGALLLLAGWLGTMLMVVKGLDVEPTIGVAIIAATPALLQIFLTFRGERAKRKAQEAAARAETEAARGDQREAAEQARYERMQGIAEKLREDLLALAEAKDAEIERLTSRLNQTEERHAREVTYLNQRVNRLEGDRWRYRQMLLEAGVPADKLDAPERRAGGDS